MMFWVVWHRGFRDKKNDAIFENIAYGIGGPPTSSQNTPFSKRVFEKVDVSSTPTVISREIFTVS